MPAPPQVHECTNADACTYTNRSTDLEAHQRQLAAGNASLDVAAYQALQCAVGYWGE